MNNKKEHYGNESITALKGADRVRKRPSVIFGSDGLDGCQHSFFEILSNSIDEAREGHGSEIKIIRHLDHSITVVDHGRGVPVDFNTKEERYNYELIYCELYAGGKYNNANAESYEFSLGLNGLGACATQYSSEYMDVFVKRDGFEYKLHFEKGNPAAEMIKVPYSGKDTGTTHIWKPDIEVFTDINIPVSYYQDVLKRQAIVNKGLSFIFVDEETETTQEFYYENGILDYLEEINDGKALTPTRYFEDESMGRDREDKPDYKVKLQVAFSFNNEANLLEYYHNSSFLEYGGSPDRAVKSAFIYELDKLIRQLGKYQKDEKKITFIDVEDSLVLVTNTFSTVTSYENQTKKAITNKFIQDYLTQFLRDKLEVYFIENMEEAQRVADQILINKRSREKAEKTRLNLKKTLGGKIDVINRVKKFVDCRSRDIGKRELYIVEGDSALGACKLARDSEFQALMPIRGKILNCLKADYEKIFDSEIIVDLIKVLGCGVEIKTKHNKDFDTFNIDQLRWDKVIICTDADVDGYQIRTLLLTVFYRLMPSLLKAGRVFIAESPLFEINTAKETHFAFNEKEKQVLMKELGKKITQVQRSKGLGENEPEMMWKTTMCPASRRLIEVEPENEYDTQRMFEVLLGEDIDGRKQIISEKGEEYLDLLDLS